MSTIDQEAMVFVIERLAGPKAMGAVAVLLEHPDGMDWPAYLGTTADAIVASLTAYWTRGADRAIDAADECGGVSRDVAFLMRHWRDADNGVRSWAQERAARTWAIYALPDVA